MGLEEVKYDGFISYRHGGIDQITAEKLQKKLELFKVPKNLLHKANRPKINRIFRDQTELPLVANLSEPIEDALKNADKLILICSPRLLESVWCDREVEHFIKYHGRENIITVLVEGEPDTAFPKRITEIEKEVYDKNGNKTIEIEHIEPLAADVRTSKKAEYNKLLDDAVIRIAACICGLNYDDLKQRHREQAFRKRLAVLGGITVASLGATALSTSLLLDIKSKNNTIELQNAQIEGQNEELSIKNNNLQLSHATEMANAAKELYTNGQTMDALYALMSVMPSTMEGEKDKPYSADAHRALNMVLNEYDVNPSFRSINSIEMKKKYSNIVASENGKYIGLSDSNISYDIYNAESGELIEYIDNISSDFRKRNIGFLGDRYFIYTTAEGVFALDCDNDVSIAIDDFDEMYSSFGTYVYIYDNMIAVQRRELCVIYDKDLNIINSINIKKTSNGYIIEEIIIQNDYLFVIEKNITDANVCIRKINYLTNELLAENLFHNIIPKNYYILNDEIYFVEDLVTDISHEVYCNNLSCIDIDTLELRWKTEVEADVSYISYIEGLDACIIAGFGKVILVDVESGNIEKTSYTSEMIKGICQLNPELIFVVDNSFKTYMWTNSSYDKLAYDYGFFSPIPDLKAEHIYFVGNRMFVMYENYNYLICYELSSADMEKSNLEYNDNDYNEPGLLIDVVSDGKLDDEPDEWDLYDNRKVLVDYKNDCIELKDKDGNRIWNKEIIMANVSKIIFDDSSDIFLIVKRNGNIEFTGTDDGITRKTAYDDYYQVKSFNYNPKERYYTLFTSVDMFLFDKDLNEVGSYVNCIKYVETNDSLIFRFSMDYYETHLYSYEELYTIAVQRLGEYKPSDEILVKYNISDEY